MKAEIGKDTVLGLHGLEDETMILQMRWGVKGEYTCKTNPRNFSICMGKTKSEHTTYPMFVLVAI